MTNAHLLLGEVDEALACGTRALEIAERIGDLGIRTLTATYLAQAHYHRGDYEPAVAVAAGNLALRSADGVYEVFGIGTPPAVYDRCWLIVSLAEIGRFAETAEAEAESIRLAPLAQLAGPTVGLANWAAGEVHLLMGDWPKARSLFEHSVVVLREANYVLVLSLSVASAASVLAQLGETSDAQSRLQEGEQLVERHVASGFVGSLGYVYRHLGRAALVLGQLDDARCLGERAVAFSPRRPGYLAHAFHLLGDIATHSEHFDAERGEAHYREALALAEPRGMRPLVAHCHLGLGKLQRRAGNREKAQEHLTTAMTMYCEMGMTYWLAQVEAELRQLA